MPGGAVRNETAFVLVLLVTKVTSHGPCKLAVAVGNVSSQSLLPRVNFRTVRTLVDWPLIEWIWVVSAFALWGELDCTCKINQPILQPPAETKCALFTSWNTKMILSKAISSQRFIKIIHILKRLLSIQQGSRSRARGQSLARRSCDFDGRAKCAFASCCSVCKSYCRIRTP